MAFYVIHTILSVLSVARCSLHFPAFFNVLRCISLIWFLILSSGKKILQKSVRQRQPQFKIEIPPFTVQKLNSRLPVWGLGERVSLNLHPMLESIQQNETLMPPLPGIRHILMRPKICTRAGIFQRSDTVQDLSQRGESPLFPEKTPSVRCLLPSRQAVSFCQWG